MIECDCPNCLLWSDCRDSGASHSTAARTLAVVDMMLISLKPNSTSLLAIVIPSSQWQLGACTQDGTVGKYSSEELKCLIYNKVFAETEKPDHRKRLAQDHSRSQHGPITQDRVKSIDN